MKVDSCCISFDYALSNNRLEHIYRGSGQARSAFVLTHFHNINNNHENQYPSRSTIRHHIARTLSNNRRTLSPAPRGMKPEGSFDSPFTLRDQEDCSQSGRQIHRYVKQFFSELAFTQTIKIKSGFSLGTKDFKPFGIYPSAASLSRRNEAKPITYTNNKLFFKETTQLRSFV
ncbi:MAG: hypothetical protein WC944_10510 [Candidatus Cloacimonadaceae bacterium]|nr:hypothetical protein [Candidatus Cloacimonadota bacterium]MCK9243137.1 hypothetical protein [Candidatus Cloacimonadota bacterium]